jgi:hypothetical protein
MTAVPFINPTIGRRRQCVGATIDGHTIRAPHRGDFCNVLGVVPRACRPYRVNTKGKVERMIGDIKESFVPWLDGQLVPPRPALADYDSLAHCWIQEVVLKAPPQDHQEVGGEAWLDERLQLCAVP